MATLPTLDDLQETLISIFAAFNSGRARPDHGLQWASIRDRWDRAGFRAEDFNRLAAHMVEEGTLVEGNGMYSLTDKAVQDGLIALPSDDEAESDMLACFGALKIRAGEGQMSQVIALRMRDKGYSGEEITRAMQALTDKSYVEQRGGMLILTDAGFTAM